MTKGPAPDVPDAGPRVEKCCQQLLFTHRTALTSARPWPRGDGGAGSARCSFMTPFPHLTCGSTWMESSSDRFVAVLGGAASTTCASPGIGEINNMASLRDIVPRGHGRIRLVPQDQPGGRKPVLFGYARRASGAKRLHRRPLEVPTLDNRRPGLGHLLRAHHSA